MKKKKTEWEIIGARRKNAKQNEEIKNENQETTIKPRKKRPRRK